MGRERDEMTDCRSIKALKQADTLAHRVYDAAVCGEADKSFSDIFFTSLEISQLQNTLQYNFKNQAILVRAFTHSSFVHEYSKDIKSYERLEFLGDSIVGTFVSQKLFESFEDFSEGKLSKLKSALVNEETLSEIANILKLEDLVLRGKGELKESLTNSILCDVLESMIGAISIDSSIGEAFKVLERLVTIYETETKTSFFSEKRLFMFDPKSTLQEYTMKNFGDLPKYVAKRDGDKFRVELWIEGKKCCETTNISKKNAMKEVAYKFLNQLDNNIQGVKQC